MKIREYKMSIALVTFFCVIVPSCVWGIIFLLRSIDEEARHVQEAYADEENREERLGQLRELRAQYEAVTLAEDTLRVLVKKENVVGLIEQLETIAAATNNRIEITVEEEKNEGKGKAVPKEEQPQKMAEGMFLIQPANDVVLKLSITLIGTYNNLARFVHKMENMPYYATILSLDSVRVEEEKTRTAPSRSDALLILPGRQSTPQAPQEIAEQKDLRTTLHVVFYYENGLTQSQEPAEEK